MRLLAVIGLLLLPSCAAAAVDLDRKTRDYLEGIWMIGKPPSNPVCAEGHDTTYQLEFEFRRTGGRVLYYEPFDLFSGIPIQGASRNGNDVLLALPSLGGRTVPSLHLNTLSADQIELREIAAGDRSEAQKPPTILYRCGAPDWRVNAGVSKELLAVLTSTEPKVVGFIEPADGASDAETCSPRPDKPNDATARPTGHHLQFEVFGPVHYYVFGMIGDHSWDSKLELAPIRAIRTIDKRTMRLEILDRRGGSGTWSGGGGLQPYTMTIVWDGRRIYIPEMGKSFVRCSGLAGQHSDRPGWDLAPAPLP